MTFSSILMQILIFILLIPISSAIVINEIMYNPPGNDNNFEFVEVYDENGVENLSGFIVGDDISNDTLMLIGDFIDSSFALIVEEGYNFSSVDVSVYSVGTTIGNGLKNTGDSVTLYNRSGILARAVYTSSLGGDGNGRSLELHDGVFVDSGTVGGTPGKQNNRTQQIVTGSDVSIAIRLEDPLYTLVEYDGLFTITNERPDLGVVNDIAGTFTVAGKDGTFLRKEVNQFGSADTGEFILISPGVVTLCGEILSSSPTDTVASNNKVCKDFNVIDSLSIPCDIGFSLRTNKQLYFDNESVPIQFFLTNESFPYQISYSVEDLFGSVVKNVVITKNSNNKSFSPNLKEFDRGYFVRGELSFTACNNTSPFIADEDLIIVRSAGTPPTVSSISIRTVSVGSDDSVKFGETFRIRLDVYKGNSTKSAVSAYVVDDAGGGITTHQSKMSFTEQFRKYDVTIPLQLKPNCDGNIDDGTYTIIVDGLDVTVSVPVRVKGILSTSCSRTVVERSSKSSSRKNLQARLLSYPSEVRPGETISTELELENEKDEPVYVKAWSYIYKGSTSYSGVRDSNVRTVTLEPGERTTVSLVNTIDDGLDDGLYKMKVLVNKDNQKTSTEIVEEVVVEKNVFGDGRFLQQESAPLMVEPPPRITGGVVFESSSARQLKIVPIVLVVLVCVLILVVIKWGLDG